MKMMVKYHGKLIGFGEKTRYHFLYGNVPSSIIIMYTVYYCIRFKSHILMAKKRNFIINFKIEKCSEKRKFYRHTGTRFKVCV